MEINSKEYKERLIEKKLKDYLSVFGAVSIEGPKWCGKTWTSLKNSKSAVFMDESLLTHKPVRPSFLYSIIKSSFLIMI